LNPYESRRYLEEYLLFHFGSPRQICPFELIPSQLIKFHERLRKECLLQPIKGRSANKQRKKVRALDLGCGVGRFAFELALVADEVIGMDTSASFIRAAQRMLHKKTANFVRSEFGSQPGREKLTIRRIPASTRIDFQIQDAQQLAKLKLPRFDIVAAINLLCRLPAPADFLRSLPSLVAPAGQLLLASPFSWLPTYTPKQKWLIPAEVVKVLAPEFRLVRRRDLPFLIREHRRKYQLVISDVMTFRRIAH
jgi:SAM-dependent methyltransferase